MIPHSQDLDDGTLLVEWGVSSHTRTFLCKTILLRTIRLYLSRMYRLRPINCQLIINELSLQDEILLLSGTPKGGGGLGGLSPSLSSYIKMSISVHEKMLRKKETAQIFRYLRRTTLKCYNFLVTLLVCCVWSLSSLNQIVQPSRFWMKIPNPDRFVVGIVKILILRSAWRSNKPRKIFSSNSNSADILRRPG